MNSSRINRTYKTLLFALLLTASFFAPAFSQAKGTSSPTAPTDLVKATGEYKASLNTLLTSYESSVQQAEAKVAQLKSLYDDGLLSRKEFEASQTAVAEAKAKVADVKNQLAAADVA